MKMCKILHFFHSSAYLFFFFLFFFARTIPYSLFAIETEYGVKGTQSYFTQKLLCEDFVDYLCKRFKDYGSKYIFRCFSISKMKLGHYSRSILLRAILEITFN